MNISIDFVNKLRNSGLRPTKQRLKICEVLFNTEKFLDYGNLSNRTLDEMIEGPRSA